MTLHERISALLSDNLGVDELEITLDATLGEDLGMDSLDYVEVTMALEEEFGIEISDEDAEHFKVVKDLVDFVERRTATKLE